MQVIFPRDRGPKKEASVTPSFSSESAQHRAALNHVF